MDVARLGSCDGEKRPGGLEAMEVGIRNWEGGMMVYISHRRTQNHTDGKGKKIEDGEMAGKMALWKGLITMFDYGCVI